MSIYLIPKVDGIEGFYHSQFIVNGLLETRLNLHKSESCIEPCIVLKRDIKCELYPVL